MLEVSECLFFTDRNVLQNFSHFYSASLEIVEVRVCNIQIDRQKNLWRSIRVGGCFLLIKFSTSILASLAGDQFFL